MANLMTDDRTERQQVCLPRDSEPAEVADVLADRECPVDVMLGHLGGRERIVLGDERRGELLEGGAIIRCPPVDEQTVAVET